jgi:hypothetical protein
LDLAVVFVSIAERVQRYIPDTRVIVNAVLIVVRPVTGEYKRPQLIKDSEFEPQFDTVKSAFECNLDVVKIGILGAEQSDVH